MKRIVERVDTDGQIKHKSIRHSAYHDPEKWDESLCVPSLWMMRGTFRRQSVWAATLILCDRTTVFARAGYTASDGIRRIQLNRGKFMSAPTNQSTKLAFCWQSVGTSFNTEQLITEYSLRFLDMERIDSKRGRVYFNLFAASLQATVSPFREAHSAGRRVIMMCLVSHDQRQLSTRRLIIIRSKRFMIWMVADYDLDANPATRRPHSSICRIPMVHR